MEGKGRGEKWAVTNKDEEMRRKREEVKGKKKAWDDDHCPGCDEKVEWGHPMQPRKLFDCRMAPMMVARPAPRLSPLPPREEMPDVDWAYDVPCGECKKKNINCYCAETGPTCQACKKSKQRCCYNSFSSSFCLTILSYSMSTYLER